MATLSSSRQVFFSNWDASTIASVQLPVKTCCRCSSKEGFIQETTRRQRETSLVVRADAGAQFSRRNVVLLGTSTAVGYLLLPIRPVHAIKKDPDMREKLLQDIEDLQKRVSKSLEEAKEAVTSMAEEAIASLKLGGAERVGEKVTDPKSLVDGAVPDLKVTQS